jgi:energy-coupling factor transporter transmembrane protein EcfT
MSKGVKEVVNLLKLYAWLVIPPFIILTIMYTPLEALDMSIRLLTIALVFTNILQLITPLELTYTLMRLRIPTTASLAIPMVIRLSEYMGYIVNEALIALRGRGLRRRKLLMSLPIPLVVHTIKSSTQLAEALTQKTFRNVNLVLGKPKVGLTDTLIYLYIVLMTLKYLLII